MTAKGDVMSKYDSEIPYFIYDEDGNASSWNPKKEAYIDDGELKELLLDFLDDDVPEEDIEEILNAASDENLTEEEFDRLLDEFIFKNKSKD